MKTKTPPEPAEMQDETRVRLDAMTDAELFALSLQPGREGMRAFLALSERSLRKRDSEKFTLK